MRFVYVMDPMDQVLPDKDTTFAFLRAAQARGHESLHCLPRAIIVRDGDKNARSIIQLLSDEGRRLCMIQEFIPKVTLGDKRILLLGGKPLGAINRVPRSDDLRSNIHVGGSVEECNVTEHEMTII